MYKNTPFITKFFVIINVFFPIVNSKPLMDYSRSFSSLNNGIREIPKGPISFATLIVLSFALFSACCISNSCTIISSLEKDLEIIIEKILSCDFGCSYTKSLLNIVFHNVPNPFYFVIIFLIQLIS